MYILCALLFVLFISVESTETALTIKPYEVLGVEKTASQGTIRKAYKKLQLKYHPDKQKGKQAKADAKQKIRDINSAYEIIGNPDKRAVYDDFGASKGGKTSFKSAWEFQQSNTKAEADFYKGDALITRLTSKIWESRLKGSSDIWFVDFYAPWCSHCQQMVQPYKVAAGKFDGEIEFASFNCHKEQSFCQGLSISAYPTFILYSPSQGFQTRMQTNNQQDYVDQMVKFLGDSLKYWKRLEEITQMVELTPKTFKKEVLESEDFWVIAFTGGKASAQDRCGRAMIPLTNLSAQLKGLARVGYIDCWVYNSISYCQKQFPDMNLNADSFPLFKGYARGADKGVGDHLFWSRSVNYQAGCNIVAATVKLLLKNEPVIPVITDGKDDL